MYAIHAPCQVSEQLLHGPQEIWSGGRRRYGTFLHSPLLDELKSLESMLVREAAKRNSKAENGALDKVHFRGADWLVRR